MILEWMKKMSDSLEWIDAEKELPKVDEPVLIYTPRYSGVHLAYYTGEFSENSEESPQWIILDPDDAVEPFYKVSHWAKFNYPPRV
jgi:hypothetical protein